MHNNRYLLVVQDYFTKWADAIPMPDQTAVQITAELVKLCSSFGLLDILHSDQGANFESTILWNTLEAFGVVKTRTTAYHPQRLTKSVSVTTPPHIIMSTRKKNGSVTFPLHCMPIAQVYTLPQRCHRLCSCLADSLSLLPFCIHMPLILPPTKVAFEPSSLSFKIS